MERTVISQKDAVRANVRLGTTEVSPDAKAEPVPLVKADDYSGRLVKYIPPDVIGAFTAIEGVIEGGFDPHDPYRGMYAWAVFTIILVATPFCASCARRVGYDAREGAEPPSFRPSQKGFRQKRL